MVEIVHSAMRILAGFVKQLSGRTLGNGALEAFGLVDELGRADLVAVRIRCRRDQIHR